MSYMDQQQHSNGRLVGLGVVLLLHAGLGWAFVSGLAPKLIQQVTGPLEVFEVEEPKVEEEPPPPPEKIEEIPPYVPPPVLDIALPPPPTTQNTITTQTVVATPEPPRVVEAPPPPPPPPAPKQTVKTSVDRGALLKSISRKTRPEFPNSVVRMMDADGKTEVTVNCEAFVSAEGRITDTRCGSTGYERLDELVKRFFIGIRAQPATEDGQPVGAWVSVPRFIWRVEDGR
jgi:periplasmic protein TonB